MAGRGPDSSHWPPRWPDISDPLVLEAIAAVPRHRFVPSRFSEEAYEDGPLPIGHGQTISQPYIVALMTQALSLQRESRVLEVGTGSGYQSAVLAWITPHVWSVETVPDLAAQARERLEELGYHVQVKVGNGCLGWPEHAPYDRVIVTAAGTEVPPRLVQQLANGGRLVIPVGQDVYDQTLWLIEKDDGHLRAHSLADVRFVPLVGACEHEDDEELERISRQLREVIKPGGAWRLCGW